jgi:hypothetical protein
MVSTDTLAIERYGRRAVLIVSLPLIDSDFNYVRVHHTTQLDHGNLPTDFVNFCRSPLQHRPNEQVSTVNLAISENKMFVGQHFSFCFPCVSKFLCAIA